MTLFEYLAIAFSLVLSLSGMRVVAGLPHAVRPDRRYWVHLCFVTWQLVFTVVIFWLFWSFRSVTWNFPTFVLVLASPSLIYFNACTLVPENPSSVESWREYFYSVRTRYFVGVGCWALATVAISTVVLRMPLLHSGRVPQAVMILIGVTGALSSNRRVHAGIALFVLAVSVLMAVALGLQPDLVVPS